MRSVLRRRSGFSPRVCAGRRRLLPGFHDRKRAPGCSRRQATTPAKVGVRARVEVDSRDALTPLAAPRPLRLHGAGSGSLAEPRAHAGLQRTPQRNSTRSLASRKKLRFLLAATERGSVPVFPLYPELTRVFGLIFSVPIGALLVANLALLAAVFALETLVSPESPELARRSTLGAGFFPELVLVVSRQ